MIKARVSVLLLLLAPYANAGGFLHNAMGKDLKTLPWKLHDAMLNPSTSHASKVFGQRDLQSFEETLEECQDEANDIMIKNSAFGTLCDCNPIPPDLGIPGHALSCLDSLCQYCNDEGDVCALQGGGNIFVEGTGKFGDFQTMQYISGGRTEILAYNMSENSCAVTVNGVACNSCEVQKCSEESFSYSGYLLNCTNVEDGAIIDSCANPNVDTGVFEVASEDEFNECFARNDVCDYSSKQVFHHEFVPSGRPFYGNNNASRPTPPEELAALKTCENMTDPGTYGLWYDVVGEGGVIKFTTCHDWTAINTQIAVYQGDCDGDLSCIAYNDDVGGIFEAETATACSGVGWFGKEGVTYHVRVSGHGEEAGHIFMTLFHKPINDECAGAIQIVPKINVIAPLDEATTDKLAPDQHCAIDKSFNTPQNPTAVGVWYKIIGTGEVFVATTCMEWTNVETAISVYQGNDCGSLECVPDQTRHYARCGQGPRIERQYSYMMSWITEPGKEYKIMVSAAEDNVEHIDIFGLHVEPIPPSPNGACSMAVPLDIAAGGNYGWSTGGQIMEKTCGGANSPQGAWYTMEPPYMKGKVMTATTCSDLHGIYPSMDSAISVFTSVSGDCSDLQCVDLYGTFECANGNVVGFVPEQGKKYWIAVHGADSGRPAGVYDSGDFFLAGFPIEVRPNDLCENAESISFDVEAIGSTDNATHFDYDFFCGASKDTKKSGPGVWYMVEGTGKAMRATTCSEKSEVETSIIVFKGSCDALECVVGSDSAVECEHEDAGTVTWQSENGVVYHILVSGQGFDQRGPFGLTVSEFNPVSNDQCVAAISLDGQPFNQTEIGISFYGYVNGTTTDATLSFDYGDECGYQISVPGVWYTAKGTGKPMILSTCTDATQYDSAISVFKGSCDNLECVTGRDDSPRGACPLRRDAASVGWMSEPDVDYYFYVYGAARGDDTIGIHGLLLGQLLRPVSNDFCDIAQEIFIPSIPGENVTISGTTMGATPDFDVRGNGVWYKTTGDGSAIKAFACGVPPPTEMSQQMAQAAEGDTGGRTLQSATVAMGNAVSEFEVTVLQGNCLEYEQVPTRELVGLCGKDVGFRTEVGEEYLIIVSTARRSNDGFFTFGLISMERNGVKENENSAEALESSKTPMIPEDEETMPPSEPQDLSAATTHYDLALIALVGSILIVVI